MGRLCCTPNGWFLINTLCIFAVVTQLGFNLRDFFYPRLTNTRVETRGLQGQDFPLIFKICIQPAFNKTALEETGYGYGQVFRYFQGRSVFNKSVFGWAGHTNESGTYGTVEEVYRKISTYVPEDVIEKIFLDFESGARFKLNHSHVYLERVNFPLNCLSLNLTKYPEVKNNQIQSLNFRFNGRQNISSIQINAQGRNLISHRDLFHNSFYSTGDALISDAGYLKKYGIEISENVYVEEDPSKYCKEYPNEKYESFADCDNQYVRNVCKKHNIFPIWLTDDFKNVTIQHFLSEEEASGLGLSASSKLTGTLIYSKLNTDFFPGEHWMRIFTGLEKSPCATPCRTFHTKTKFLSSVKEKKDDTFGLKLFFIPEMTVTTTDFVKPTISSMLSEVVILHMIRLN